MSDNKIIPHPILYTDLYDISNRLIAPKGSPVDFGLVRKAMKHGQKIKKTFVQFGSTPLFRYFKNIFNEEKYFTIFTPYKTNDEIANIVKNIALTKELYEELENIESHLPYTFRHILIVTALMVKMALDIHDRNYSPASAALAGLMHDLGKSRVPKQVLAKDTPLTKTEFDFLKTHSLMSYILLCYYLGPGFYDVCESARDHHEKLDGSGYPRGIKNTGRYARLMMPIDIFDALISERPYRDSPYTIRQALDFLVHEASQGKIDKEVIYCLISYVRKEHPRPEELSPYEKKDFLSRSDNIYGKIVPDP